MDLRIPRANTVSLSKTQNQNTDTWSYRSATANKLASTQTEMGDSFPFSVTDTNFVFEHAMHCMANKSKLHGRITYDVVPGRVNNGRIIQRKD
jgi:hypothetical protein